MENNEMSNEKKTNFYIFKSKGADGTLTLDTGKRASHNELMDLGSDESKRSVIKEMIKAGKKEDSSEDQLIKLKYPDELKEAA